MKLRASVFALILAVAAHANVALAQWVLDGAAISTAMGGQQDVEIVSDGVGGAIMAWTDTRGGVSYDIYAQRVDALGIPQWMHDGVVLCEAGGNQLYLKMASDGAGGAIVTWQDGRGGLNPDIYAQRVDAAGVPLWTPDGVAICTAPGTQWDPVIDADGAGGAIVAWHDERFQNFDIFVQRVNATGVPQWTFNGVALCVAPNSQINCAILSDVGGGAIVAWDDRRGSDSDIFAQRVNAFGGPKWTANGVPICTAVDDQSIPAIATDGTDGAIMAWTDNRVGFQISAQRVNTYGEPQWMIDGVALCTVSSDYTKIVSDGVGGAIVTWRDYRSSVDADIFAQRVNHFGAPQWEADGVALCTAEERQDRPEIATDGAEGAVVTWHDERTGPAPYTDIYAQRVNSAGVVEWEADGVAVCTAPHVQLDPKIVSDGAGGAIVAWEDGRNGFDADVYAQRVLVDGGFPTSVGDTPTSLVALSPNFPNPFSVDTTIELSPSASGAVEVEVFDVAGRRVRAITLGRVDAGSKRMTFDGRDESGRLLPSGVYFYRVHANGAADTRKMVIVR